MPTSPKLPDEAGRLEELQALQLQGSPSEPEFDNLTQLASEICDAPVALISFVDQDRIWFKSRVGFDALHGPRAHSFCSHAVQGTGPLVVEDATVDPRFQDNVYLQAPQGIRFYAGIPLVLSSGHAVGTLCVIDHKARTLSDRQLGSLKKLALQVTALIEAKRIALRLLDEDHNRLVIEQRLDFAMQAADIGDWDMDLRTNVARRSLKHDQCFGYTEAVPNWGYDTFLAHVMDADRARVDECFQRAMAGLGAYDVEFRVLWPDQTLHWLWSKGRFYFDESGKPNRVAGIQVDITRRKETEETLQESEYRWRFAIEGPGDGLWDWDIQNNHVFYSDRWLALLGIEKGATGHDPQVWSSHLHPEDKEHVLAQVQLHLDAQTPHYASEHRVICKDGNTKWMLGRGLVVQRDAQGRPLRMIGTNSDITDRKQTAEALRLTQGLLANAEKIGRVGGWEIDVQTRQTTWTEAVYDIYELDSTDRLSVDEGISYYTPASRAIIERAVTRAIDQGEPFELELEIISAKGNRRSVHTVGKPDRARGKVTGSFQDITERKHAEVKLQEMNLSLAESRQQLRNLVSLNENKLENEKRHIAREVHDELGQILTALRMDLSLAIIRHADQVPGLLDALNGMKMKVDRAVEGVRNVATSLRPAALDMGLVTALEWLCLEFSKNSDAQCLRHGFEEGFEIDDARAVVIFRIVQEAFTNIRKYAQASQVDITLERCEAQLRVEVRDNGLGFDPLAVAQRGTLGLLGMRERAHALGGRLEVVSTPGQSTVIELVIPLQVEVPKGPE